MDIAIRPGTLADFENWYGRKPINGCRLWVATVDGEVVCVAGYSLEHGCLYAFSGVKPEVKISPRLVFHWASKLFDEMKKPGLTLYAKADPDMKNSGKFLQKLGFQLIEPASDGDLYRWNCFP